MNIGNLGAAFQGWGAGQDEAVRRQKEQQAMEWALQDRAMKERQIADQQRAQGYFGQDLHRAFGGQNIPVPPGVGQPSVPSAQGQNGGFSPMPMPPPGEQAQMSPMKQAIQQGQPQGIRPYQAMPQAQPQQMTGGELPAPPTAKGKNEDAMSIPSIVKRLVDAGVADSDIGAVLEQYAPMIAMNSKQDLAEVRNQIALMKIQQDGENKALRAGTEAKREVAQEKRWDAMTAQGNAKEARLRQVKKQAGASGMKNVQYTYDENGIATGFNAVDNGKMVWTAYDGSAPAGKTAAGAGTVRQQLSQVRADFTAKQNADMSYVKTPGGIAHQKKIDALEKQVTNGEAKTATEGKGENTYPEGSTATNPKTGVKKIKRGGVWQPL